MHHSFSFYRLHKKPGNGNLTFTSVGLVGRRRFPGLLDESVAALFTVVSTRVMLAAAHQPVRFSGMSYVTRCSVSVAHTSASYGYVFDAVEILKQKDKLGNKTTFNGVSFAGMEGTDPSQKTWA